MTPVDRIALVLALALGATIVLILVATIIQIVNASRPQVQLSENATQVLVTGVGALSGLLGAYIGSRRRDPNP